MNDRLIGAACALAGVLTGIGSTSAATISKLTTISGPISGAPTLPVPLLTVYPDSDENAAQVNFAQLVTALSIVGNAPVDFELMAVDSGTGGTTEYLLNMWVVNATGTTWSGIMYSLSARDIDGGQVNVPGLDFDWPDKTALGQASANFSVLEHNQYMMAWRVGAVGMGENEITTFAVDVPDIGQDYIVVLTLKVPEPVGGPCLSAGLSVLMLRRRLSTD